MKLKLIYSIIILIIFQIESSSIETMRIAIMDFQAKKIPKTTASVISDIIRTEMINIKKYIIVERTQVDMILKETGFQQSGCTDEKCAVKIGKLLSAKKLLVGSVSKLGTKYIINGRLVDVEKGISEFGENVIVNSEDELAEAVKLFALNLSTRIEGGLPEAISNTNTYIDKSHVIDNQNIQIGESRFIKKRANSIYDKKTGLEWERKPSSSKMSQDEADAYLKVINFYEDKEWRIPTKKEFSSMLIGGNKRSSDRLREIGFKNIKAEMYWTSTEDPQDGNKAWSIDLGTDFADTSSKASRYYIWLVK